MNHEALAAEPLLEPTIRAASAPMPLQLERQLFQPEAVPDAPEAPEPE